MQEAGAIAVNFEQTDILDKRIGTQRSS